MESSGFFNASLISAEAGYDRVYVAEQFANYFAMFIGNGVFADSGMLQVVESNNVDMTILVKPGKAFINGYWYCNDADKVIKINPADGILDRYDAIVVRMDVQERKITLDKIQGASGSPAQYPTILRNGDYYDLLLAYVYVKNGITGVSNDLIIDKRLDNSLCGQVEALIKQPDVSKYGSQLNNFIERYIEQMKEKEKDYEISFMEWFDKMKGQLSKDAAGNLQVQIDEMADIVKHGSGYIVVDIPKDGWTAYESVKNINGKIVITDSYYEIEIDVADIKSTDYVMYSLVEDESTTDAMYNMYDNIRELDTESDRIKITLDGGVGLENMVPISILLKR